MHLKLLLLSLLTIHLAAASSKFKLLLVDHLTLHLLRLDVVCWKYAMLMISGDAKPEWSSLSQFGAGD